MFVFPPAGRRPRNPSQATPRRGISTIWLLIALPTLLVMFCFVVNIANLWLARVELENALEAAALAAVMEWGQDPGGTTEDARDAGVAYAQANRVRGMNLVIDNNFDPNPGPNNPNENLTYTLGKTPPAGNLIFGAIIDDDPLTFDATEPAGCSNANVLVEVCKGPEIGGGGGASGTTQPDAIGVFYRDGDPGITITKVAITLPVAGNNFNQQPYWAGSFADDTKKPKVSIKGSPEPAVPNGCQNNLNNMNPETVTLDNAMPPTTVDTYDVRGIDPSPTVGDLGTPQDSDWSCPNGNGDGVCFTFADQVPTFTDRFRTVEINFAPGAFEPPSDPNDSDTWEFIRYGASLNNFGPSAYPGEGQNNNSGDMFGIAGATVTITFSDNSTCTRTFVNTGGQDSRSEAVCGGGGSDNTFAVRAQAQVNIPLLCGPFFLFAADSYCVTAKATAMFDCETGKARLIRVRNENFLTP